MSPLGVVHTSFAFLALAAGGILFRLDKGTRWHRTLGHVYAMGMAGVVVTSLSIYRLTGRFGPLHAAALVAGVSLAGGLWTVLGRRPRGQWMAAHATWMSWSYVGLAAAFVAESLTRFIMPRVAHLLVEGYMRGVFWTTVVVASGAVGWAGSWLIRRRLPGALAATPAAMRAERTQLRRLDGGEG